MSQIESCETKKNYSYEGKLSDRIFFLMPFSKVSRHSKELVELNTASSINVNVNVRHTY